MFFTFQISIATEKDSLNLYYKNYFKRQLALVDDDCDACGCSASGGSMGFASMLNSNFVGVRYFNQQYRSSDGLYSNSPWYNERFNTTQVWARIPILEKLQVSIQIPYHHHTRGTENGNEIIEGLGDINALAMYSLYQTHKDSTLFVHTLKVGAGVKLPTGKYNQANSGLVNPSFQLGTGSWDYSLLSEYVIKRKNIGLNTMINYVFKTVNSKNYQFGNQFNYATTLFYLYETEDKFSIAPQLGIAGEIYGSNYQYEQKIRYTEGQVLFGKLGFEMGKNRFSIGANTMFPLQQDLASGRVEAQIRWSLNLNYSL